MTVTLFRRFYAACRARGRTREGMDEKGRDDVYRRGFSDGMLAARAGGECVDHIELLGHPTGGSRD